MKEVGKVALKPLQESVQHQARVQKMEEQSRSRFYGQNGIPQHVSRYNVRGENKDVRHVVGKLHPSRTASSSNGLARSQQTIPRARFISGGTEYSGNVSVRKSNSPIQNGRATSRPASATPIRASKSSANCDEYFAMAKFNESPDASALPPPPIHWCMAIANNRKNEPESKGDVDDALDLTMRLKTMLRVDK